jgi:hypothetical protein
VFTTWTISSAHTIEQRLHTKLAAGIPHAMSEHRESSLRRILAGNLVA